MLFEALNENIYVEYSPQPIK